MTTPYVDPQTIHNPSTGASPPAAWGDAVRDDLEFLARTPGCVLKATANQSSYTASGFWYDVSWNAPADLRDTDGFHTGTGAVVKIPTGLGGWYMIAGSVVFDVNAAGSRQVRYSINAAGDNRLAQVPSAGASFATRLSFAETVRLNAGDELRIAGRQDSGGPLLITAGCALSVHMVALP